MATYPGVTNLAQVAGLIRPHLGEYDAVFGVVHLQLDEIKGIGLSPFGVLLIELSFFIRHW
ncbi:hypothetical protein [Serratia sp. (in: enterobacteria)]|uniref:hypothetical protein n=1 Tax=Serratia sp. (in: enterobacteria) TaxID=616 RepID=UPI003989B7C5